MAHDQSTAQTSHQQQDWPAVLDEPRVQVLVCDSHRDRDLSELFRSNAGWKVDYEDSGTVLFARSHATREWA